MSIDKATKLKSLADKGYKGEKGAAQKILERYLEKHGIRMEDLESDHRSDKVFKYKNGERQLLVQIIGMVPGNPRVFGTHGRANRLVAKVTEQEAVEIRAMYDHYSRVYAEELDVFMIAFISKNELWRDRPLNEKGRKPSQEERERRARALKMANGVRREGFRKQLGGRDS